jgi:hypothetical protein
MSHGSRPRLPDLIVLQRVLANSYDSAITW